MGAYSRWVLIRGWALIRINTVDVELVKSCWVKVNPCNGKAHVVIGYIYRHPSVHIDDFTRKLDELIKNLNWKKL